MCELTEISLPGLARLFFLLRSSRCSHLRRLLSPFGLASVRGRFRSAKRVIIFLNAAAASIVAIALDELAVFFFHPRGYFVRPGEKY